ncbi:hypothetical protein [Tenacibaculum dicentrarchi]|uniref:hypothetical protein n=1 Tax=Tenacibaculum dicentrarchi TaxID=669041 RepID=UPI003513A721
MDIKEFTFTGFINIDWSDDFKTIKLTDENKSIDLVKKFRAIFDLFESEVSVSYFISDSKKTEEEIKEGWLKQLFGGITAEYETSSYNYSSYTYGTDYDTYLKIGGHDLFDEFDSFIDKYCVLKINVKTE